MGSRRRRPTRKRSSRKLQKSLDEVTDLLEEGELEEAQGRLLELSREHPRSRPVLHTLLDVSQELQD
jgi:hypothetical protein